MYKPAFRTLSALIVLAGLSLLRPAASASLVITPVWDSSITSDPNAATIMATINTAIQVYKTKFSDPITVKIKFQEVASGLGQSSTYIGFINYTDFLTALIADAKTGNDTIALAHLASGLNNPVNGNSQVYLTTANFRALGFTADPPNGDPDSTIGVNMSLCNLTRTNIDPNKYDLQAVVSHEIDEALGLGSVLNGRPNSPIVTPADPVSIMDLFRYNQNGIRSLTTDPNALAYFSLDGVTRLARFNQSAPGDYQDWFSTGAHTPQVQDAFGTPGATPDLNVELTALDAIGYDLKITVTGRVRLEGVSNLTAISSGAPLGTFRVSFRAPGTTTEIFGTNVTLAPVGAGSPFGTYSITNAPTGVYDVTIKGNKSLRVAVGSNVVIASGVTTLPDAILPAGDANNDNSVGIADFGVLVNAYLGDFTVAGSGYDPKADFNYDGRDDIGDFGLLVAEYSNTGVP